MTKDEKIRKVLKVLKLSEKDQYEWFEENFELEGYSSRSGFVPTESMCDAVFRMRDEMMHEDSDSWALGCWYVTCWEMFGIIKKSIKNIQSRINAEHYVLDHSPIYWLVAIYIANLLKEPLEVTEQN